MRVPGAASQAWRLCFAPAHALEPPLLAYKRRTVFVCCANDA